MDPQSFFAGSDPDPAVILNADPDLGNKMNADPCGPGSTALIRIRIKRIRIRNASVYIRNFTFPLLSN